MPIDRNILVLTLNIADAAPILAALESHNEKCFVRSIVILLSSAPTTHGASLTELVLSDHESYVYSAYIIETTEDKMVSLVQ